MILLKNDKPEFRKITKLNVDVVSPNKHGDDIKCTYYRICKMGWLLLAFTVTPKTICTLMISTYISRLQGQLGISGVKI